MGPLVAVACGLVFAGLSGCFDDYSAGAGPDINASPPPRYEVAKEPFQWSGDTGTTVGASAAGQMHYQGIGSANARQVPLPARPLALDGTVTWDALTPLSDVMAVFFLVLDPSGIGYPRLEVLSGSSPLEFAFDLESLAGWDAYLVVDYDYCADTPAAEACAMPTQAFDVDSIVSFERAV